MKLTDKLKNQIDAMSYESMLRQWRFAPIGDLMFQGESGDYFSKVMQEKKKNVDSTKISKSIGW